MEFDRTFYQYIKKITFSHWILLWLQVMTTLAGRWSSLTPAGCLRSTSWTTTSFSCEQFDLFQSLRVSMKESWNLVNVSHSPRRNILTRRSNKRRCTLYCFCTCRYLKGTLDQYVESDYTLIYFHHGLTSENKPSFSWLRDAYREFDRK